MPPGQGSDGLTVDASRTKPKPGILRFLLRLVSLVGEIDLTDWGVVAYPMRYQPLEPCVKDSYVSPNWTKEQLEMIARARRVIGYGGAFPPYEGLRRKLSDAKNFEEAFELRPLHTR